MIRWRERTLQTKTALILTLFTWISAALIGISSRSALDLMVHRHIDLELNDVANDFHAILHTETYPFSDVQTSRWNRRLAIHPRHRMFVQVFDQQGLLKWSSITAQIHPRKRTCKLTNIAPSISTESSTALWHCASQSPQTAPPKPCKVQSYKSAAPWN